MFEQGQNFLNNDLKKVIFVIQNQLTMKKIGILIVYCCFSFTLFSQTTFASKANSYKWVYNELSFGNIMSNYVDSYSQDSILKNGRYYHEIGKYFIRDSASKVFCLPVNSAKEFLLMDYLLNVGDTFRTFTDRNVVFRVESKNKVKIGNDSLTKITMNPASSPRNWPTMEWIESIGCISNGYHPINWTQFYGYSDVGFNLTCILKNDTNLLSQFGKTCFDNDLLNTKKKWIGWASSDNGDHKYLDIYQANSTGTIVNGKHYIGMQTSVYARYDSLERKYYLLYNNGSSEAMVYKENSKIGDTIYSFNQNNKIVQKIENKWFNNVYRKIYVVHNDTFASGIGSLNSTIWNNHYIVIPEYRSGALCYEENGQINYHYPYYYQNKNSCEISNSVREANNIPIEIRILDRKILVTSYQPIKKGTQLYLFNSVGQMVQTFSLTDVKIQEFEIQELNRGWYIVNVVSDKIMISKKFVIE